MKRLPLLIYFISAFLLLFSGNALAATKSFYASSYASIRSHTPNTRFLGYEMYINYDKRQTDPDTEYALFKFDLSELPENAIIRAAKVNMSVLYFYSVDNNSNYITGNVEISRISSDWTSSMVNWNNQPSTSTPKSQTSIHTNLSTPAWDVTDTVKGWKDGVYRNYGFMLKGIAQTYNYHVNFSAVEDRTDKPPTLYVVYDEPIDLNIQLRPIIKHIDLTAPSISDIKVKTISDVSAEITWKTNEKTNGFIDYGKTASYGKTANGELDKTDHTLWLYDLEPNTTYHYKVRVKDAFGNESKSSDKTLKTNEANAMGDGPPEGTNVTPAVPAAPTTPAAPAVPATPTNTPPSIPAAPAAVPATPTNTPPSESEQPQEEQEPQTDYQARAEEAAVFQSSPSEQEPVAQSDWKTKVALLSALLSLVFALGLIILLLVRVRGAKQNTQQPPTQILPLEQTLNK